MGFLDLFVLLIGIVLFIWILTKISKSFSKREERPKFNSLEEERAYLEQMGRYRAEQEIKSREREDRESEKARKRYYKKNPLGPLGL